MLGTKHTWRRIKLTQKYWLQTLKGSAWLCRERWLEFVCKCRNLYGPISWSPPTNCWTISSPAPDRIQRSSGTGKLKDHPEIKVIIAWSGFKLEYFVNKLNLKFYFFGKRSILETLSFTFPYPQIRWFSKGSANSVWIWELIMRRQM